MSLIGVHTSDLLDVDSNVWKNIKLFQIFVSSTVDYHSEKYKNILKYVKKNNIHLLVHASYSINIARDWKSSDSMVQQFIAEIQRASDIGAFAIVIHVGKHLDLSIPEALNNMYTLLLYVHSKTAKTKVQILIETPAGQGSETLVNIDDFCKFMNKFYKHPNKEIKERFGMCVDTCHIFAAGYDIRTKQQTDYFYSVIDKTIGIDKIKVCHINDSKKGLGSRTDRHENIGHGEIGLEPLKRIISFMKSLEVPIIFETPANLIYSDYLIAQS